MEYKPKVITGKVTGTGWPIDGHVLWFSQWDYDNRESWHLYGWEDSEDEAVMQTVFQTETEAGLCLFDTLEKFAENWKAKKWEPQGIEFWPEDGPVNDMFYFIDDPDGYEIEVMKID